MARIENVEFLDRTTGPTDIDEARAWEDPSRSGRIHRTAEERWFLDATGVPFQEIRPRSAAALLLSWGWDLPSALVRAVGEVEEAGHGPRPRLPLSSLTPVILNGPDANPIVLGVPVPPLTGTQYAVVRVLVEAGPPGLSLPQLQRKSRHEDARKALKRVARSAPEWGSVIRFAGRPHGRYRIAAPA